MDMEESEEVRRRQRRRAAASAAACHRNGRYVFLSAPAAAALRAAPARS